MWLLLCVPLIVPIIALVGLRRMLSVAQMAALVGTMLVPVGMYQLGRMSSASDTEVWNGVVTGKDSIKHSCPFGWNRSRSYHCNVYSTREVYNGRKCTPTYRTNSDGKRVKTGETCRNVYRTEYNYHYEWEQDWYIQTSLRKFYVRRQDSQGAVEPARYTSAQVGDPVSVTNSFENVIKAVPASLFDVNDSIMSDYANMIPTYPSQIYDMYKINRVLNVQANVTSEQVNDLNLRIGKLLGKLNPQKQINIVVILTSSPDSSFMDAVEYSWLGGKKNDLVVGVNIDSSNQVQWAKAFTWGRSTGNEDLVGTLSGAITGEFSVDNVYNAIEQNVQLFKRPSAAQFEKFKAKVLAPTWVAIACFILSSIACMLIFVWAKNEKPVRRGSNSFGPR
jgi:hypothetical protein